MCKVAPYFYLLICYLKTDDSIIAAHVSFSGGKCLLAHFGGGSRGTANKKKKVLLDGMGPYFDKGLYLNTSVGFGYMRKLFYYFVVDDDTLDITIFEMQDPKNAVWTAGSMAKLSNLFKSSYELSYPFPSPVNTISVHRTISVNDTYVVAASTSVFRRGNASDNSHWTKHCHSMQNESVVQIIKTPEDDEVLL